MRYLVLLLLLTDSFFVAVTAVVADLLLVAAVSDFADAETEDEVVSVATADFADSNPENCSLFENLHDFSMPRCMPRFIMRGSHYRLLEADSRSA